MPRRPRLHVPYGYYHVTLRGNHRQAIFFRDSDRATLELIVAESLELVSARLHAYCWMTNHVHLLVQVSDVPLGRLILRIAGKYARIVQAAMKTTGHLFERRHHAVLVDSDRYLLTLVRYIHMNPVRAKLVDAPWGLSVDQPSRVCGHAWQSVGHHAAWRSECFLLIQRRQGASIWN